MRGHTLGNTVSVEINMFIRSTGHSLVELFEPVLSVTNGWLENVLQ